jgi:hypothetical protein
MSEVDALSTPSHEAPAGIADFTAEELVRELTALTQTSLTYKQEALITLAKRMPDVISPFTCPYRSYPTDPSIRGQMLGQEFKDLDLVQGSYFLKPVHPDLQQSTEDICFNLYAVDNNGQVTVFSQTISYDWTSENVDGQEEKPWKDSRGNKFKNLDEACQLYLAGTPFKPGVPKPKEQ